MVNIIDRPILAFIVSLLCFNVSIAQVDSIKLVAYNPGFRFTDGIYINQQQMVQNQPIPLSKIVTKINKSSFDFFERLLSEEKISYLNTYGLTQEIKVEEIWGFCRRGSIYINWGDDFTRITIVGNICHFVSSVTINDDRNFDNNFIYGYSMPSATSHTEIRQYIMNFESGKILEYTTENVGVELMPDTELFDEYNKLKKKKKRDLKFLYIRKFNEKHPLYIPIY